jgi:hypothetical protein
VNSTEKIEAELLLGVRQKAAAFEHASDRCRERPGDTLQECLEQLAHDFRDALGAFSDFVLDGQYQNKPKPSGGK